MGLFQKDTLHVERYSDVPYPLIDTPSFLFLNKFHQMKSSRKDTMTISAQCATARDHKSRSRAITFCGMDPSHFRAFLENEKAVSTKDIDKYGDMASVVGLGPFVRSGWSYDQEDIKDEIQRRQAAPRGSKIHTASPATPQFMRRFYNRRATIIGLELCK